MTEATASADWHVPLGSTGLQVSRLGFGAMQVGDPSLPESVAAALLHGVLDLGIRLIDTARSYGIAEERIGRILGTRRDEFVVSTKVGYDVDGVRDWSHEAVVRGVDAARGRLRTDVIDIVFLHSCDRTTIEREGLLDALEEVVARGWVRFPAYSGDEAAADWLASTGRLPVLQWSYNLCDQRSRSRLPSLAAGIGIIGKRPFAGLPWLADVAPEDPPHATYWQRFQALQREIRTPVDWAEFALRFAAHGPGVHCCLAGGQKLDNVQRNVAWVRRGPLPATERLAVERAFDRLGRDWAGII